MAAADTSLPADTSQSQNLFSADSFGGVGALVARPLFGWRLAAAGRCGCFWAAARSLTRSGHVAPSGHRRLQRTCGCLIRRLRAFEGRHLLLSCCLWLVVPAVVWMSFGCDPCARLGALRRSAGLVRRQRTSRCVPTFTRHWSRRAAYLWIGDMCVFAEVDRLGHGTRLSN